MEFISRNHHILEKIFKFCKNSTLLQCRLVCSMWAEEVTRILKKRGVTLALRSIEDVETFLEVNRPLDYLTYTNFLVDIPSPMTPEGGQVEQVPVQVVDLLDCYKDELLELKLWYQPIIRIPSSEQLEEPEPEGTAESQDEEDVKVIFKRLHILHLLSNYVHPSSGQPQVQHQMPSYFKHLSIPNLKFLSIQHLYDTECAATVVNLIKSSGNSLEYFKIPAKPFPMICMDIGSLLEGLRELDLFGIFNGFSCATNDTLEAVMRRCPRLEKLGIEFSFRATLDRIQEMLGVLAGTLVEFRCTIQDRNLLARQVIRVDLIFPEMKKLKVLQMRWSNPGLVYYIDRLPVLEELMLDTVWTRKVPGSIFPGGQAFREGGDVGPFGRLTCLKLTEILGVEQVQVFAKYFPSLKVLGCSFRGNEALRKVYEEMGGLTLLIVERKSNVTEKGAVLGVDEEDGELEKWDEEAQGQEFQRKFAYIGNLKNLERLELCQLGLSWLSLVHGVGDLPKLKHLVIPSKAFRKPVESTTNSDSLVAFTANRLPLLRNLKLWIRHTSERPSKEEIIFIQQTLYNLQDVSVVNHSLCGI